MTMGRIQDFAIMLPFFAEPSQDEFEKCSAFLFREWRRQLAAANATAVSEPVIEYRPNPNFGKPVVKDGVELTEPGTDIPVIDNVVAGMWCVGQAVKPL